MANIWKQYQNGNMKVRVSLRDGTRIYEADQDGYIPLYPEKVHLVISTGGPVSLPYWKGEESPIRYAELGGFSFLNEIYPYTFVKIDLNLPLHPEFYRLLLELQKRHIFVELNIRQEDFIESGHIIKTLYARGMVHRLNVIFMEATEELIHALHTYPNSYLSIISGIFTPMDDFLLRNKGLKLLVHGFDRKGMADGWYRKNQKSVQKNQLYMKTEVPNMLRDFTVVHFDSLAIEELRPRSSLTKAQWKEYFRDDRPLNLYINMVDRVYGRSSEDTALRPMEYKSVQQMFDSLKERSVEGEA